MEIEVLDFDKKANRLAVAIKDTNAAFVNAIRRIAMEEVPVLAIEDVELRKNSTVMYDEMIALRLGLVPIKTEPGALNLPAECKCAGAGCAQCQVKFILNVTEPGYVYSEELKGKDPKIKPVLDKLPVAKMIKGQKLEIEATAVLGQGKEHAKWSPGIVYYKHYPIIKATTDIKDPALAEKFPGIFTEKGGKIAINEAALIKSNLTDSIDEITGGAVKVEDKENDFIIYIESWGQLECKEILAEALRIYSEKIEALQKALK